MLSGPPSVLLDADSICRSRARAPLAASCRFGGGSAVIPPRGGGGGWLMSSNASKSQVDAVRAHAGPEGTSEEEEEEEDVGVVVTVGIRGTRPPEVVVDW